MLHRGYQEKARISCGNRLTGGRLMQAIRNAKVRYRDKINHLCLTKVCMGE
jgi:hypothetical protein